MTLYDYLKNILLLLVFIYISPFLFEGIRTHCTHFFEPRTQIGILEIPNTFNDSWASIEQLHLFFKNPRIKGILVTIDYTGSITGTDYALFNEIQLLKKEYQKPIVALIENACGSGGYLLACATDYIIAPKAAIITMPQQEKEVINAPQNDIYNNAIKQIAAARTLSLATTSDWADGKICTGHQALDIRLIDETGSLYNAITFFKHKALVVGEIEWTKRQTCWISSLPISIQ